MRLCTHQGTSKKSILLFTHQVRRHNFHARVTWPQWRHKISHKKTSILKYLLSVNPNIFNWLYTPCLSTVSLTAVLLFYDLSEQINILSTLSNKEDNKFVVRPFIAIDPEWAAKDSNRWRIKCISLDFHLFWLTNVKAAAAVSYQSPISIRHRRGAGGDNISIDLCRHGVKEGFDQIVGSRTEFYWNLNIQWSQ